MNKERKIPQPPQELIDEGRDWAIEQYLPEINASLREKLQLMFVAGIHIYQAHRKNVIDAIEKEGGIDKIYNEFSDNAFSPRGIRCKSGATISAEDIFSTEVLLQSLPEPLDMIPEAKQAYQIKVSYGGFGFDSEDVGRDTFGVHMHRHTLEMFLDPEDFPNDIGITESVITGYKHHADNLSRHYSVKTRSWRPSLDGIETGILITDMSFSATREKRNEEGHLVSSMFPYVGESGFIKKPREGLLKLNRFEELLRFAYKDVLLTDLPEKYQNVFLPQLSTGIVQED